MTFTASNGLTMWIDENGDLANQDRPGGGKGCILNDLWVKALREFFQHEEDKRLGRWRWPENREWVAYPPRPGFTAVDGADLLVINEVWGAAMKYERALDDGSEYVEQDEMAARVARAYFDAHPEPKPWRDAKPGEVWVISEDGEADHAYLVDDTQFYDSARDRALNFDDMAITAARRIWPEDAS